MKKEPEMKQTIPVFREQDGKPVLCFDIPDKQPGKYVVSFEQQGPPLVWEFDTLEEAEDFARSEWGSGAVGIFMPDGSEYEGDESWGMRAYINLVRLRKGRLNPRQQHLLKRWESGRWLKRYLDQLREGAFCFDDVLRSMEDLMEDAEAARKLFLESVTWGLLEIVRWQNGWIEARGDMIDKAIEAGKARSL